MAEGTRYNWTPIEEEQGYYTGPQVRQQYRLQVNPIDPAQMGPGIGFSPQGPYRALPAVNQTLPSISQWLQPECVPGPSGMGQYPQTSTAAGPAPSGWEFQRPGTSGFAAPLRGQPTVQPGPSAYTTPPPPAPPPSTSSLLYQLLCGTFPEELQTQQPESPPTTIEPSHVPDTPASPSTDVTDNSSDDTDTYTMTHLRPPPPVKPSTTPEPTTDETAGDTPSIKTESPTTVDVRLTAADLADLSWKPFQSLVADLPLKMRNELRCVRDREVRRRAAARHKQKRQEHLTQLTLQVETLTAENNRLHQELTCSQQEVARGQSIINRYRRLRRTGIPPPVIPPPTPPLTLTPPCHLNLTP